jgi:hypothetical protein
MACSRSCDIQAILHHFKAALQKCLRRHTHLMVLACSLSAAAVRPCLEAPLLKRLDRRELVSLALVADASAERAEKVSQQQHCAKCWSNAFMPGGGPHQRPHE